MVTASESGEREELSSRERGEMEREKKWKKKPKSIKARSTLCPCPDLGVEVLFQSVSELQRPTKGTARLPSINIYQY